jgi:glycosyltransferase involved in cell wall biosynthesis
MSSPKISIVTVVLNAVSSIDRCVGSLLSQTYDNTEYLVIDGGSTDGTLVRLAPYRDRIDYLVSEPDRGLYHAMNKGIRAATGDYVYFLNSDDVFCDGDVLADVASAMEKNPSIDLVYGDVLLRHGERFDRKRPPPILNRESLCRKGCCHQAVFARKTLLAETDGFSLEYRVVADLDWLARALARGATTMYLERDIAVFSLDGMSAAMNWREEKRRCLQANFTRWELFRWRKLPGILGRR